MKKLKWLVCSLVFIFILTGCGSADTKDTKNIVENEEVFMNISNRIRTIEAIPEVIDLYKKGEFDSKSFSNEGLLQYGLIGSYKLENHYDLSAAEKVTLTRAGIRNVDSYIKVEDMDDVVASTFGAVTVNQQEKVGGCPSFIYDNAKKIYYVSAVCNDDAQIVSYIDTITTDGTKYYVTIYAGIISGDKKIYGDFNNKKFIADYNPESDGFEITSDSKDKYTKFQYTFIKNTDGNYVLNSFKAI